MPQYIVADTHIHHDGKPYAPGEVIELTKDQAAALSVLPAPEETDSQAAARKMAEELTVAQLTERLTALKVDIPQGSKKAALVALYLAATDYADYQPPAGE